MGDWWRNSSGLPGGCKSINKHRLKAAGGKGLRVLGTELIGVSSMENR